MWIAIGASLALAMLAAAETGDANEQTGDGLDLWVLFGGISLFLAIVVAITLLRRWQ